MTSEEQQDAQRSQKLLREFRLMDPEQRRKLRELHRNDGNGLCVQCSIGVHAKTWPCTLAQLEHDSQQHPERW